MKIGLIAPPWIPVPPPKYGGTESVIDNLARGLTQLGHEVKLFTVGESTCPVERDHLFPEEMRPMGFGIAEAAHALAAYESLADCDIIHDHTVIGPLVAGRSRVAKVPVVVTHHGIYTDQTRRIFREVARSAWMVAISADQARRAGDVPISAVIHHGIDLDVYRPGSGSGSHLVFIGRMSPDKGVHRAVRIARMTGRPLRIICKMRDPDEFAYYEDVVHPMLGSEDDGPQELPLAERLVVLQEAAALVNPLSWPEPFGLVMAESLACGTPVIATPYGAAPEIVTHARTGFLIEGPNDGACAVSRLRLLDRADCRADAEHRFSMQRMAADHLRLYERLLMSDLTTPTRKPISLVEPAIGHTSATA